jgi:hypothetical protein
MTTETFWPAHDEPAGTLPTSVSIGNIRSNAAL